MLTATLSLDLCMLLLDNTQSDTTGSIRHIGLLIIFPKFDTLSLKNDPIFVELNSNLSF